MSGQVRIWTEAQLAGITVHDRSLLVSAAAGSGKTAVLAERCVYLVCDAPDPCDVDELLVVTFTESAASEMKQRIQQSLRRRIESVSERVPRLERQLAIIEQARVSTLHGFCARLLRQHFQMADLDPAFRVMDGDEAALLRSEIVRELFEALYETDTDGHFHHFVDCYGDGQDEGLMQKVVSTHELLNSLIDPTGWRASAVRRLEEGATLPLDQSELGRTLGEALRKELDALKSMCKHAADQIKEMGGFDVYVQQLRDLWRVVSMWDTTFTNDGMDALAEVVRDYEQPRAPTMRNAPSGKERAKQLLDDVKKLMQKGPLRELLSRTSEQVRADLGATVPHARVFLDLVERFGEKYVLAKRADRMLDFSDLERLALNVLRDGTGAVSDASPLKPSDTARAHHRQFRYVLVDEYQDINEIQDAILTLVSRECVVDRAGIGPRGMRPNLFCVGDVKQSIFRFRLAEPERFLARQKAFRKPEFEKFGSVIDLRENFRSRSELLGAVNGVFKRLMTERAVEIEYDETQQLRAGAAFPASESGTLRGAPVELHILPQEAVGASSDESDTSDDAGPQDDLDRTDYEALFIADQVRSLMGLDGKSSRRVVTERGGDGWVTRPLRFGDIVVLLRSLKFKADQFTDTLRARGIPVYSDGGSGFFNATEVRDMIALLSVLDNPRQDVPLAAFLRSPLACLAHPEDAMARVRLAYPISETAPVAFHDAIFKYADEQSDELAARLQELLAQLRAWRDLAHTRPLAEVLWTIYDESGYLSYCSGLRDGAQRVANLIHLHERATQFGGFLRQGLYRFLRFLSTLSEQQDPAKPSVAAEARDVVRIMSVHKSKGLEFPVVFVPDLGKRFNLKDNAGSILVDRRAFLGLHVADETLRIRYPSLASRGVSERIRNASLAEEMRLLYVALTRAREQLILVGTTTEARLKAWQENASSYTGVMPAPDVLRAAGPLDWLGPVTFMNTPDHPERVELVLHTPDELQAWAGPVTSAQAVPETLRRFARLEPIVPAPAVSGAVQRVIDRVTAPYAFRSFTQVAASQSVTSWAKSGALVGVGFDDALLSSYRSKARPVESLATPRCVQVDLAATPVDKGTATHLLLQHLKWDHAGGREELVAQAQDLVARQLITRAQAAVIDFETVNWFHGSELGQTIRANLGGLQREVPFYLAHAPDVSTTLPPDPFDQVMIRGRIDLLLALEGGAVLVDYKTDNVDTEARIAERANFYRPQMQLYARGIAKITGQPVAGVYLIFLTARRIVEVRA